MGLATSSHNIDTPIPFDNYTHLYFVSKYEFDFYKLFISIVLETNIFRLGNVYGLKCHKSTSISKSG